MTGSTPGRIQPCDSRFRKAVLYPELSYGRVRVDRPGWWPHGSASILASGYRRATPPAEGAIDDVTADPSHDYRVYSRSFLAPVACRHHSPSHLIIGSSNAAFSSSAARATCRGERRLQTRRAPRSTYCDPVTRGHSRT